MVSENLKKFLEKVSEDKALMAKISAESDMAALIAQAKELGFELTEVDFKRPVEEMTEEELDNVAGGSDVSCACALGGGGTKDNNDKTCACVLAGAGYTKTGRERCVCGFAGYGYDS